MARSLREHPIPLGEKVSYVIGELFDGIYHRGSAVLHERVKWQNDRTIEIVLPDIFCTGRLKKLIELSESAGIDLAISGASPNYLRIKFWEREI
jgi:hypothetical protein